MLQKKSIRIRPNIFQTSGFTLIEILVAISLLTLLGLMLARILRGVAEVWHHAESQRICQESAQSIFSMLEQDLATLHISKNTGDKVQFWKDANSFGQPRVRWIRKFSEKEYPELQKAGILPLTEGYDKYFYGIPDGQKLRASGGLAEVAYTMFPGSNSQKLYRGFRTPVGGIESFFQAKGMDATAVTKYFQLLADNVLYFGMQGWTSHTTSWKSGQSGPIQEWAIQEANKIPLKIQVNLMIRGDHAPLAYLYSELLPKQDMLFVQEERNFPAPSLYRNVVRIGDELIGYTQAENRRLYGLQRGLFGTKIQQHPKGTPIFWGNWYTIILSLPYGYETWHP